MRCRSSGDLERGRPVPAHLELPGNGLAKVSAPVQVVSHDARVDGSRAVYASDDSSRAATTGRSERPSVVGLGSSELARSVDEQRDRIACHGDHDLAQRDPCLADQEGI